MLVFLADVAYCCDCVTYTALFVTPVGLLLSPRLFQEGVRHAVEHQEPRSELGRNAAQNLKRNERREDRNRSE